MQTERQISQLLAKRAAEWMETLKQGDRRDNAAFVEWLRDSKLHVEYYLEMEALDRQIQALDAADRPDIEAFVAAAASNVRRLEPRETASAMTKRPRLRFWTVAATVAGMVVFGSLAALGYRSLTTPRDGASTAVATAVGEQRMLTLPDGSLIRMNVETTLQYAYSPAERRIELSAGEAVFKVAHDASRPLVVHTPTANIRAVGTEFNVSQRPGQATVVSVLDGRVQVTTHPSQATGSAEPSPITESLGIGEEAQVTNGRIEKRAHPDVAKTVAWREGRLYFDEMPLDEIVREFNRYGSPVKLKVEGIAPGSHRFGGTFNADDPASLADILEQQDDLIVERRPGAILIHPRQPEGPQQTN